MIVFVAGMPRSGSTFSFNVAHDALPARGLSTSLRRPQTALKELARAGDAKNVVFKVHQLDETAAAEIKSLL